MLRDWQKKFPGRVETLFRSLQNIVPSHLADAKLFDFHSLQTQDKPFPGGDIGFDREPLPAGAGDLVNFPLTIA